MPQTWQRTTTRGAVSEADLRTAIERIRSKEISIREASRTYNIGRQTLDRYLQATPEGEKAKKTSKTFSNTVFSQDEEKSLFDYAEKSAAMHFGLTSKALAELAYDYGKKLGKKLPSGWEANKAAGEEWCLAFRRRNGLSLRTPENTSIARSQAFSLTNVQGFHEALSVALLKHDFGPCSVWNLDETGITTVTKAPKLLSPTGTRQVGAVVSAERGILITMCACVSTAGRALPPPRAAVSAKTSAASLGDRRSTGITHPRERLGLDGQGDVPQGAAALHQPHGRLGAAAAAPRIRQSLLPCHPPGHQHRPGARGGDCDTAGALQPPNATP